MLQRIMFSFERAGVTYGVKLWGIAMETRTTLSCITNELCRITRPTSNEITRTSMSANDQDDFGEENNTSKKKMASVERDLYLKPLLRLKQQEDVLQRGLATAIENIKLDSNLWQDIVHESKEMATKRQNFFNALYKNMENITTEMESIKHITRHPEELENLDVNTYKLKLIKLSQKMQDLKKSCSVQSLREEQTVLEAELRDIQPTLPKYEKLQKNVSSPALCPNKTENKKGNQSYKDVHDFHALVALTGHTDSWSMEDHLFFLKMRKKCENVPTLVAAIQKKYPDLSVESIVNHESWYKQYENLRDRQRVAVKEWRKRKEREKMRSIEQLEKFTDFRELGNASNETDKDNGNAVSRKVKSCSMETRRTNGSADSSASEKKELIKRWRIEKESKRSMDEEQLRTRMKLKREMEENKRQKRRERIQEVLEDYRRKKSDEDALKGLNEQSRERCKYDSTLIKAFRKQDEEFTKKRRDLIERSKKPSKSETISIKRMELIDARNYSTLFDSTKVWRERCKAVSWTNNCNDSYYIKDIPRTCTRWRNEESEDLKI